MNLIDCHSHTNHSPDAADSAVSMCERAIELGLSAYAVTDHCEVNRFYSIAHHGGVANDYDTYDFGVDFEKSVAEITILKGQFDGRLNLLCGVELGQATFDSDTAEKVANDKRLDFIIGSIHQLHTALDFSFLDYSKYDVNNLLHEYYNEMYQLCQWNKFDVLGHLTYTLRYIEGENGIKVDMSRFTEQIRACFRVLIENGKGIEINTSGLRQKYGKSFPSLEYVKMFREMGGEVLSLGSDAHCVKDLGSGIQTGAEIALAAGFKRVCYFKERKPHFVSIG